MLLISGIREKATIDKIARREIIIQIILTFLRKDMVNNNFQFTFNFQFSIFKKMLLYMYLQKVTPEIKLNENLSL